MIEIVCIFFPALFSTFALERLLKKRLCLRNFLMVFVTNTICINIVGLFFMFCFSPKAVMPMTTNSGLNLKYSFIYLTLVSVIAIIAVIIERFYFYRLRIGVVDNTNENKETK